MQDNQTYSELWYSQNSLFKHFQRYLGVFMDIDALTDTQLGGGRGEKN